MEISVKLGTARTLRTACVVVAVFSGKRLSATAQTIDKASRGLLSRVIKRGDINGNEGEALMLPDVPGVTAERVLLIGAGRQDGIGPRDFLKVLAARVARWPMRASARPRVPWARFGSESGISPGRPDKPSSPSRARAIASSS